MALIRGGGLAGGVLSIQTLIKNILRKVGNYPTYRFPYILREVGNHPTDANQEYIKNGRKLSYIWNS